MSSQSPGAGRAGRNDGDLAHDRHPVPDRRCRGVGPAGREYAGRLRPGPNESPDFYQEWASARITWPACRCILPTP